MRQTIKNEIKEYAIEQIKELADYKADIYGCDLHNEIFNTDYYIIGTYEAKEWLKVYGTFDAIGKIQEYENDMFGEVYTDISDPEKVSNMLVYIIGEEILSESETLEYLWDDYLTVTDLNTIAEEL